MEQVIKFSRLSLLVKNHLLENKNRYILYALGMFFIGLIVFILLVINFNFYPDYYYVTNGQINNPNDLTRWEETQLILYYGGLFAFGGIFACTGFVNFSNSAEAIFYLNKPASYFEKWLTQIMVHVFFFFIVYTILFYLLNIPFVLIARSLEYANHIEANPYMSGRQLHLTRVMWFAKSHEEELKRFIIYPGIASAYLSLVGFFMYGAVLFNRFSFFKTLILGFAVGMVYFMVGLFLVDNDLLMPGEWNYSFPFHATHYVPYEIDMEASYSDTFMVSLVYLLLVLVPSVLFTCSYLKLKEKEV